MSKKKSTKEEKLKQIEPTFREAEGEFESVGVQNGNCYIVVGGKKVSCPKGYLIKIKIEKK